MATLLTRPENEVTKTAPEAPTSHHAGSLLPAELVQIVEAAAVAGDWIGRVRLCADRRWYERIYHSDEHDVWVISWMPSQSTGFHDHGASAGAFVVATGVLEELRPDGRTYIAEPGSPRGFGPDYSHDVRNNSGAPAVSIHAYSPPLTEMNNYDLEEGLLIPRTVASLTELTNTTRRGQIQHSQDPVSKSGIDQVLTGARARLRRITPEDAYKAATREGAVLVDIRPAKQRAAEGSIPGALVVERNVLEWRFDPTSAARLSIANSLDLQVIVFCSQAYASSLAAAQLQDIGLWRATDLIGGFQGWEAEGLPTQAPSEIERTAFDRSAS